MNVPELEVVRDYRLAKSKKKIIPILGQTYGCGRNEDSLRRWKCLLTGEYLVYPFQGRGNECPVEFPGGEESE